MKIILSIVLLLLCGACATRHGEVTVVPFLESEIIAPEAMNELVIYAMSLAETPYRYGGSTSEKGFDCSGFVHHVFLKSLGLKLPRSSLEMSRAGKPLSENQLQPGDLVFFNTMQQPYSHVGIYVGENRFVHAPKEGKGIILVNMREKYWRNRYDGARRMTKHEASL
jgi:cell wall-associated NlpC family hydrolase